MCVEGREVLGHELITYLIFHHQGFLLHCLDQKSLTPYI
jgi:hypothetical protein